MKTVRRLFYKDIVSSVLFVAIAFLSLFFFIDFVTSSVTWAAATPCRMRRCIRCCRFPGISMSCRPSPC